MRGASQLILAGDIDEHSGMVRGRSSSAMITDVNGKTGSWGFWPWALISLLVLGGLGWLVWNSYLDLGMGSFKWILWSLLALAGLFTVTGLMQMTRRHPLVDEKRWAARADLALSPSYRALYLVWPAGLSGSPKSLRSAACKGR